MVNRLGKGDDGTSVTDYDEEGIQREFFITAALAGVEVQTEKTWGFCEQYGLPRAFVVNQMDRDRASFDRTLGALREAFGRQVVPVQLPLGEEKGFRGVIDLVRMKAAAYGPNGAGKAKESDIPPELSDAATKAHEALVE